MSTLIEKMAMAIVAHKHCEVGAVVAEGWRDRWAARLEHIERNALPSGSGIDAGTKIDVDRSTLDKIVLTTSFHHMDESGGYNGWSDHTVVVTPSFVSNFEINVTGRNRNGIKEYLADTFRAALDAPYEYTDII